MGMVDGHSVGRGKRVGDGVGPGRGVSNADGVDDERLLVGAMDDDVEVGIMLWTVSCGKEGCIEGNRLLLVAEGQREALRSVVGASDANEGVLIGMLADGDAV